MNLNNFLKPFEETENIYFNLDILNEDSTMFCTNNFGDDYEHVDFDKYGNDEVIWCDIERNGKRNILHIGIEHWED